MKDRSTLSMRKFVEISVFNIIFFLLYLVVFLIRITPCKIFIINTLGSIYGIIMMFIEIRQWNCIMEFAVNIGDNSPGFSYVLRHFVQAGIDYVWGYLYYDPGSKLGQYFEVENREIIDQAVKDGKGVIVISAHYGPMITTFMLNNMYGNIKRPVTLDNFERWVKMSQYTIKPFRSSMHEFLSNPKSSIVSGKAEKEMVIHVKKGGILFMYIDGPGPIRENEVDFFGFRFNPHYFPFKLSLLYDLPIVFCSLQKKISGGYVLRMTSCNDFSSPHEGFMQYISFLKALVSADPSSWLILPALCRKK